MPSVKGRLVKFMLQHRHVFQFKLKKEMIDWNKYESLLQFRQEVEEGAGKFGKMPDDIQVTPVQIGRLYTEWISPAQATRNQAMLYFSVEGM